MSEPVDSGEVVQEYLSTVDVSVVLGVSVQTARKRVRDWGLGVYRIGRLKRFSRKELDGVLAGMVEVEGNISNKTSR